MTKKELEAKYTDILAHDGAFKMMGIETINQHPHPFTLGTRHINAARQHGGKITPEIANMYPCARPGCGLPYTAHRHDTVMMLSLTRSLFKQEAGVILQKVKDAGMTEDGIDGFIFIDTEEQYRFL